MPAIESGHRRKKQPDIVRRALLDAAARLSVENGLASVTVQAVAEAAGVTKGGLVHHFASKQALIDSMFTELLDKIAADLSRRIKADPEPYGSFTRAYLEAIVDGDWGSAHSPWATLSIAMLTEPALRDLWNRWFEAHMEEHRSTDGDVRLSAVRLAADGLWLADLAGTSLPDRPALLAHLLEATRQPL